MRIHSTNSPISTQTSFPSQSGQRTLPSEEIKFAAFMTSRLSRKGPVDASERKFLSISKVILRIFNNPKGVSFIRAIEREEHHPLSVISLSDLCQMRRCFDAMIKFNNVAGAQVIQSLYFSDATSKALFNRLVDEEEKVNNSI